eukprot:10459859-Alexandrium_andersonii.AAC.1
MRTRLSSSQLRSTAPSAILSGREGVAPRGRTNGVASAISGRRGSAGEEERAVAKATRAAMAASGTATRTPTTTPRSPVAGRKTAAGMRRLRAPSPERGPGPGRTPVAAIANMAEGMLEPTAAARAEG